MLSLSKIGKLALPIGLLLLAVPGWLPARAQGSFNSGSDGSDLAFNPTNSQTVQLPADGRFDYTTVNIPAGVTINYSRPTGGGNPPVLMLAQGNITIAGTINIDGGTGNSVEFSGNNSAGLGGPGGFNGGGSGYRVVGFFNGIAGAGPGGGDGAGFANAETGGFSGAGGGFTTNGGDGSCSGTGCTVPRGGNSYGAVTLVPLVGGSGGGGGGGSSQFRGGGGGGGGGAILIASSGTITFSTATTPATISARGGNGQFVNSQNHSGGGAGGAVRIIANNITGSVNVAVNGGQGGSGVNTGSHGRVRIEAFNSNGLNLSLTPSNNPAIISFAQPNPVNPPDAPTLRIASVAGMNAPANPANTLHGAPDITVPNSQTNPVNVAIEATNIPVGTMVEVRVAQNTGPHAIVQSTALAGTTASSTATASVNLAEGMNLITATVVITPSAPLVGSRQPLMMEGERVTRIEISATFGGSSQRTYVLQSGRRITVGGS